MMSAFTESTVEQTALARVESTGWAIAHGPDIAPDMPATERADYGNVVLARRLREVRVRLNPEPPDVTVEGALRKLARFTRPTGQAGSADLAQSNGTVKGLPVNRVTLVAG